MKGKTLRQFIDDLHYNAETEFILHNTKYIISGWTNEDGTYTLSLNTISENGNALFGHTAKSRDECVDAFVNAKVFDNKNIYDVEKDIIVLYG